MKIGKFSLFQNQALYFPRYSRYLPKNLLTFGIPGAEKMVYFFMGILTRVLTHFYAIESAYILLGASALFYVSEKGYI